jgi:hypothetical protein
LSYIQKSRRKAIKNRPKQQEQRLTLEDLCRRRKQEEETISTRYYQFHFNDFLLYQLFVFFHVNQFFFYNN